MHRTFDPAAEAASDPQGESPHRSAARDRYIAVRNTSLDLVRGLSAEDAQVQSMPDCSPTKWHLAHTTWFFETFLLAAMLPDYRVFDPAFGYLFNSYYETVGPRHERPKRGLLTRPSLETVFAYRAHVDAAMAALLGASDIAWSQAEPLITLGLHHEQQHQELILMDIKHAFSCNPLEPAFRPGAGQTAWSISPVGWIPIDGGLRQIGHDGRGFAFDNEGPRHKVWLEPFALADRLVTAGDYADFIADGGYRTAALWLSDGWAAVQREGWSAPLYWREEGSGGWSVFTLSGRRPIDPAEPVCHISFYEADAYARWAGARLPTEAEWETAAARLEHAPGALMDDRRLHPQPASGSAGSGLRQMVGDVWEWTASSYLPYPGFRTAPGAVGEYNGKFMSGQMVLRGGACVTAADHVRISYRNFFPPEARWAFSGLRLARDA